MNGNKRGVVRHTQDIEVRVLHTHCHGHTLNMATGDTLKRLKIIKDALDKTINYQTHEMTPGDSIFQHLKDTPSTVNTPGIYSTLTIKVDSTVRAESIHSILANY